MNERRKSNNTENNLTIYKNAQKIAKENRELPHICKFCVKAHTLYDSETMLCDRKGIVSCEFSCKKFSYDPFKHIPAQTPPMLAFDENWLSLDSDDDSESVFPVSYTHGDDEIIKEDTVKNIGNQFELAEAYSDNADTDRSENPEYEMIANQSSEISTLPNLSFSAH